MIYFEKTLAAWNTPAFEAAFMREVEQLGAAQLPLQQSLSQSSYAADKHLSVIVLGCTASQDSIQVRAGIFYTGILPGCACSDDVAPASEYTEYCEVCFDIDKRTAAATVKLLHA